MKETGDDNNSIAHFRLARNPPLFPGELVVFGRDHCAVRKAPYAELGRFAVGRVVLKPETVAVVLSVKTVQLYEENEKPVIGIEVCFLHGVHGLLWWWDDTDDIRKIAETGKGATEKDESAP